MQYHDEYNTSKDLSEQYNETFFGAFMAAVYPGLPSDENPANTIEFLASEQPNEEGQIKWDKHLQMFAE